MEPLQVRFVLPKEYDRAGRVIITTKGRRIRVPTVEGNKLQPGDCFVIVPSDTLFTHVRKVG